MMKVLKRRLWVVLPMVLLLTTSAAADEPIESDSALFEVRIESRRHAAQGHQLLMPVTLERGKELVNSFDLLISYDHDALHFLSARMGNVFGDRWQRFSYETDSILGEDCTWHSLVRFVGSKDYFPIWPPQPEHDTSDSDSAELFKIRFQVSNERGQDCRLTPVRFCWRDCSDNVILDDSGVTHGSRLVQDYSANMPRPYYELATTGFPSFMGVTDDCADTGAGAPALSRYVDFINGAVDVMCRGTVSVIGDIDMDRDGDQAGDLALFSDALVYGTHLFDVDHEEQVRRTDIKFDGSPLKLADFQCLQRIVVGDALPYAKVLPDTTKLTIDDGVLSVMDPMGAAYVIVADSVVPALLAEQMDMRYHFDGRQTRILISSEKVNQTFVGEFLAVKGELVHIELASDIGSSIEIER